MSYVHILPDYSVQFFDSDGFFHVSYQDEVLNEISSGIARIVYGSANCHFVVKVERRRNTPFVGFQSVSGRSRRSPSTIVSEPRNTPFADFQSVRELGIFTKFANTGVFPKVYGSDVHISYDNQTEYATTVVIVEKIEDCPTKKYSLGISAQAFRLGRKYGIGDLHLENYFVTPEGQIKIIDAGIPRQY